MINQINLLNSIKDYLTRFQLLVKIANANSEFDINNHSENIIIPILNIIFNGQFKNANESEKRNFESLDLIDDQRRMGIQVTSSNNIDKIKATLAKFLKYGYEKRVDKVYIYILSEKQRSYSQDAIDKIVKNKITFDVRLQIIDAKDIYRLLKSLNNISVFQRVNELLEEQFSDLNISKGFNYTDFKTFKESYKEKCLNNFSRLNFFGLSVSRRPREVELYELFVPPKFKDDRNYTSHLLNSYHDKGLLSNELINSNFTISNNLKIPFSDLLIKNSIFKIEDFFQFQTISDPFELVDTEFKDIYKVSHNIVILGNPGAGKSSMIKYSICKILENDNAIFDDDDIYSYLPIRIELHKYNQVKIARHIGFAEFLVEMFSKEYQTVISLERLIKILTFFPCLIFFDGLDEIFDIQERIEVRNDIENFATTYKNARIIVTSRFESYEEVRLRGDFYRLEVKDFNQVQLENYVERWYTIEERDTHKRALEIAGCLDQLKHVDDELKFNPLLLSLILILYRNELELPTNKLSIYEGCTTTIVETRDTKEKKLNINLRISNKISVFSALAFWQFDNANKKINNQIVQRFIKDYC